MRSPSSGSRFRDGGPSGAVVGTDESGGLVSLLIDQMADGWMRGERPISEDYLKRHPDLWDRREDLVRLVYEEHCLRREAGCPASLSEFSGRFPHLRAELEILVGCDRLLTDAASGPEFPTIGETIAGFRIVSELGRGARGRVYLALQPDLASRPVVVKAAPAEGGEHRSLARLQHTHVVPLLSVDDDPGRGLRMLCLPYLGGTTLENVLHALAAIAPGDRTGLDIVRAIDDAGRAATIPSPGDGPARSFLRRETYVRSICWIASCLADGLHHAHTRGLLHLDVKPANILLAADGMPMLLDFHLARGPIVAGGPPPAWLGGTAGYLAPEQEAAMDAIRRGATVPGVDARADVHALGVVLYRSLAGASPPTDPRRVRPRLVGANREVGPTLAAAVARCLAADPADRYPDAASLADDLRRHLADRPLRGVRNRGLGERLTKWRRREPGAVPRLVAAVACASALAAGAWTVAAAEIRTCREADAALDRGRHQLDAGDAPGADRTLDVGRRLLDPSWLPDLLRPGATALRREIAQLRGEVRSARLADELHALAERARFAFATAEADARPDPALGERLVNLWEARSEVVRQLDRADHPARREALRADLLDVAIFHADLVVRSGGGDVASRQRAMSILADAESAYGTSPILDRLRREQAAAIGEPHTRTATLDDARQPRTAWELHALGRLRLRSGDLAGAAADLGRAVELQPNALWPQFDRGRCALRRGRPAEALDAFGACVALAPDLAACRYNRGLAYRMLGDSEHAQTDFAAARRLDPSFIAGPDPHPR